MDIRRQVAYAENARRLLRETLAAHPQTLDQPFETTAQHKTIGQLVAHLVGAERRWTLGRLYGEAAPPRYEDGAAGTLEGLFADWDAIRARTLAFAARADDRALGRVITTELPQWGVGVRVTAEEVLLHLCNHQTWHVGQISMALQRLGVDPPNFDYVLLREDTPQKQEAAGFAVNVEAVIYDGDRYLMAFRSEQEAHAGGTLAFAGGKVEGMDIENVLEETLRREIREEVGVEVNDLVYVESHSFGQAPPCVDIVFLCRYLSGTPTAVDPAEVSAVRWMTLGEVLAHPQTPPWIARSLEAADAKRTRK
jgi:8-oxo-dGTP diphosphatase